jgi:hypothetical protein
MSLIESTALSHYDINCKKFCSTGLSTKSSVASSSLLVFPPIFIKSAMSAKKAPKIPKFFVAIFQKNKYFFQTLPPRP